ncbi:MAG: hypothetical protein QOH57_2337 [Mycobacterium sp.]|nr:hypothetical protein [Mycobacterium sp.]
MDGPCLPPARESSRCGADLHDRGGLIHRHPEAAFHAAAQIAFRKIVSYRVGPAGVDDAVVIESHCAVADHQASLGAESLVEHDWDAPQAAGDGINGDAADVGGTKFLTPLLEPR